MLDVFELDVGDGDVEVLDVHRILLLLQSVLDDDEVERDLLLLDVELDDERPPPLCFFSDDEEALVRIEEGDPVRGLVNRDGVVEEREDEFREAFGDEEEGGGAGGRSGSGGGKGTSFGQGEGEDTFEDFDRDSQGGQVSHV